MKCVIIILLTLVECNLFSQVTDNVFVKGSFNDDIEILDRRITFLLSKKSCKGDLQNLRFYHFFQLGYD